MSHPTDVPLCPVCKTVAAVVRRDSEHPPWRCMRCGPFDVEEDAEDVGCAVCGEAYALDEPDHEPTRHCHRCAHLVLESLDAIVVELRVYGDSKGSVASWAGAGTMLADFLERALARAEQWAAEDL